MSAPSAAELAALRRGAAWCRHGLRFLVRVDGADAVAWLDRICSNPVKDLAAGRTTAATLLDAKGKLRADLRVLAAGDPTAEGLLLELPASHRAALLRVLDLYIIKDKVRLGDLSAEQELVSLLGPRAAEVLAAAGLPAPGRGEVARARDGLLLLASDLAGVPGFDLVLPVTAVETEGAVLRAAGATEVGLAALDLLRIEHGVPWFSRDLADGVIPLEALLDARVSITKGCYPGQEVVARIQNLGQVARKLVRLRAEGDGEIRPGAELVGTGEAAGKRAGGVTSAAKEPGRPAVALGYVRRAFWRSGTRLAAADTPVVVENLAGD